MSGEAQLEALLEIINTSARQAIAEYKKGGNDVPTIYFKTSHPMDFATDTIALRNAVRLLEGAFQQLSASLTPPQHIINNHSLPTEWACMDVIVRAKVADALEKYPNGLHIDELSKLVNLEKGKLARVLRLLASKGCFIEVERNTFANNRLSLVTLSNSDSGAFARTMLENASQGALALFETLTQPEYATSNHPEKAPIIYALRKKGIKGNYFDVLKQNAEKREYYHRAMAGINRAMGSFSILHYYPWNEVNTVCDVGSGIGAISRPLAIAQPHLKITCQDLPEVIPRAKDVWAIEAPEVLQNSRVEFATLNFLEESPVQGQDVYYLRNIIHDWPDVEVGVILTNVRKAMAPHSRLLIHGTLLPPSIRDSGGKTSSFGLYATPDPLLPNIANRAYQQDMAMLFLHNARERTLEESIALGSSVGLKLEKAYDLSDTAVLDFRIAPV